MRNIRRQKGTLECKRDPASAVSPKGCPFEVQISLHIQRILQGYAPLPSHSSALLDSEVPRPLNNGRDRWRTGFPEMMRFHAQTLFSLLCRLLHDRNLQTRFHAKSLP